MFRRSRRLRNTPVTEIRGRMFIFNAVKKRPWEPAGRAGTVHEELATLSHPLQLRPVNSRGRGGGSHCCHSLRFQTYGEVTLASAGVKQGVFDVHFFPHSPAALPQQTLSTLAVKPRSEVWNSRVLQLVAAKRLYQIILLKVVNNTRVFACDWFGW